MASWLHISPVYRNLLQQSRLTSGRRITSVCLVTAHAVYLSVQQYLYQLGTQQLPRGTHLAGDSTIFQARCGNSVVCTHCRS